MQGDDTRMQGWHITKEYSPSQQLRFTIIFFMQNQDTWYKCNIFNSWFSVKMFKFEYKYWFLAMSIMLYFRPREGDTINVIRSDSISRSYLEIVSVREYRFEGGSTNTLHHFCLDLDKESAFKTAKCRGSESGQSTWMTFASCFSWDLCWRQLVICRPC